MRRIAPLLAGITLLGGCGSEPTGTPTNFQTPVAISQAESSEGSASAEGRDLASLRRATASFHRFEAATAAGWSAQITGCMSSPDGGMGFHYGNPAIIDGAVSVDAPELLLYEPEENGRMRLVAVEYIVPLSAWTSASPPRLFGHDFHVNAAFGIWALHAWVWKKNPSGMFADWNPNVSCAETNDVSTMSHD